MGEADGEEVLVVAALARVVRLRGEGSGVGVAAGESWKSEGWLRVATIFAGVQSESMRRRCGEEYGECDGFARCAK